MGVRAKVVKFQRFHKNHNSNDSSTFNLLFMFFMYLLISAFLTVARDEKKARVAARNKKFSDNKKR